MEPNAGHRGVRRSWRAPRSHSPTMYSLHRCNRCQQVPTGACDDLAPAGDLPLKALPVKRCRLQRLQRSRVLRLQDPSPRAPFKSDSNCCPVIPEYAPDSGSWHADLPARVDHIADARCHAHVSGLDWSERRTSRPAGHPVRRRGCAASRAGQRPQWTRASKATSRRAPTLRHWSSRSPRSSPGLWRNSRSSHGQGPALISGPRLAR